MLWESVSCVCNLTSQNRGRADKAWFDSLRRLRQMEWTDDDVATFNTRFCGHDSQPEWMKDALNIAYRNEDVNRANETCLRQQSNPVVEIRAHHSIRPTREHDTDYIDSAVVSRMLSAAAEPNQQRDREIPASTNLAIGAPVVLTVNLEQAAGLCNGTRGTIHDFMFKPGSDIPIVLVRVTDKYRGPSFLEHEANIVPVVPRRISWGAKNDPLRTHRTGLPLRLGYAMTVRKVQDLTCSSLVFDPTGLPTSAFAYVALSRVKTRERIALTHLIDIKMTVEQRRASEILRAEIQRIETKSEATTQGNRELVLRMKYLSTTENALVR